MGKDLPPLDMDMPDDTFIELPDDYAVVSYVEDNGVDIFLEPTGLMTQVIDNTQGRVCIIEKAWLSHVLDINNKGKHDGKWQLDEVPVTYAGFFSNKQVDEIRPRAVIGVFPVFTEEKLDTVSMQKHTMLVVKKAINFVNPGQTPVLEGDCTLYAHQKQCQF